MRMMSGEDGGENEEKINLKFNLIKKLIKKSSWLAVSHNKIFTKLYSYLTLS